MTLKQLLLIKAASRFNIIMHKCLFQMEVTREGGSLGEAELEWTVQNDPDGDLIETSGKIQFDPGQNQGNIEIKIRGDTTPELDEVFMVEITSVSVVGLRLT